MKKREIEDTIWSNTNLTPTERLVALAICRHHNDKTGQCNPSQERLARLTGLTDRAVRKAVSSLRTKGLIETRAKRTLQVRFLCSLCVYRNDVPGKAEPRSGLAENYSEFFGTLDDQEKAWWAKHKPDKDE